MESGGLDRQNGELDAVFDALAGERRRRILELLRAGERSAGEIAAEFEVSWPAVSRHLRVLREAGLVSDRRVGRVRRYRLNRERLRQTLGRWAGAFERSRRVVEPVSGAGGASEVAELYDEWSGTYDVDANRTRELAARVLRALDLGGAEGDVVELGCGTGANTRWLAGRARSVVGLDISVGMLARARERVGADRVRFVRHDVASPWPLAPGSADLLVAMLVLEHVPELAPVFAESARVLRPGGSLFLCELHPARQQAGSQARFDRPEGGGTVRVPAHLHVASEYVNAGVGAGLEVHRLDEWGDERDAAESRVPRLLSVRFRRPAG